MGLKKIMTAALIAALAVMTLTACGTKKEETKVNYPAKPITLIVPFSAGGISDTMARAIAETGKKYLSQPINVVNRAGGSGTTGSNEVIKAAPDGYTLLYGSSGELASGLHLVKAPYKVGDYTPINKVGTMRVVLAVKKDAPWKDLKEFVEYARNNPEKVTVGIPGKGTVVHLTGEDFSQKAGIKLNVVPFQGSGPLLPALLGGHVDAALLNVPEIMNQYKAGEANILAVFSDERVGVVKDVLTAKEQGFDVDGGASHFIVGPKGLPPEVIKTLQEAMQKITQDPQFLQTTDTLGYQVEYADTAASETFLQKWYQSAGEIYQKLGMSQQ